MIIKKRRNLTEHIESAQKRSENRAKKIKKKHKNKTKVKKPLETIREESQTAQRESLQAFQLSIVQTNPQTQTQVSSKKEAIKSEERIWEAFFQK